MAENFVFDEEFCKEEVRWDYKITTQMKKVWAIEIDIALELERVCKKHGLKYVAAYGTMLGAVRHKGYIPWDDDLDFYMPRPDYEILKKVGPEEFKEPYFYQNTHTDTIICSFSKIKRTDTTAIEFPDKEPSYNQGIFVDIFPIDDFTDGSEEKNMIYLFQRDIWTIITKPILGHCEVYQPEKNPYKFTLDRDIVVDLMKLSRPEQLEEFEKLCNSYYGTSPYCGNIMNEFRANNQIYKSKWFDNIIMMPFENIEIPVSADYDEFLTLLYKDYMTPVKGGSCHEGIFLDPDHPYIDYMTGKLQIPEEYLKNARKL